MKKIDNKLIGNENVWLNGNDIINLFNVDRSVITKHINNIYNEEELEEDLTSAKIAQVQKEGNRTVKRNISYYNLDMIISIGYRVNSKKATKFRIWATKILKDYVIKGFAIDVEKMKNVIINVVFFFVNTISKPLYTIVIK